MDVRVESTKDDYVSIRLVDRTDDFFSIELASQKVGHLFPETNLPIVKRIPAETSWGMSLTTLVQDIAWNKLVHKSGTSDIALYEFLLKERSNLERMGMTYFGEVDQPDVVTDSMYGFGEVAGYRPESIESLLVGIEVANKRTDSELLRVARRYGRKLFEVGSTP